MKLANKRKATVETEDRKRMMEAYLREMARKNNKPMVKKNPGKPQAKVAPPLPGSKKKPGKPQAKVVRKKITKPKGKTKTKLKAQVKRDFPGQGNRLIDGKEVKGNCAAKKEQKKRKKIIVMPGRGVRLDGKPTVTGEGGVDDKHTVTDAGGEDVEMVKVSFDNSIIGLMERIQNKDAGLLKCLKGAVEEKHEEFTKAISRQRSIESRSNESTRRYQIDRMRGGDVMDGGGVLLGRAEDYPVDDRDEGDKEGGEPGGAEDGDEDSSNDKYSENPCTNMWTATYNDWDTPRTKYTDYFMLFSKARVKSFIRETYELEGIVGRCQLLPRNMAMIPSLWWSVVYHFMLHAPENVGREWVPDMESVLMLMLPEKNWTYLSAKIRGR